MTESDRNGLTDRQLKALPFFITSTSESKSCRRAGISKQTFYDWLKNPQFRAELTRTRNLVVDDAIEALKGHISKAVQSLVSLLDVAQSPALIRSVANDIIGHVSKFKEIHEIEHRLDSIEDMLERQGKGI